MFTALGLSLQNTMSDDKTMTQTSARKKTINNNTSKAHAQRMARGKALAAAKAKAAAAETADGKENIDKQTDDPQGELDEDKLPANGHGVRSASERKINFVKQASEASSSGATAEYVMNDSMITNESLADKSFATSISIGGQTDISAGGESVTSNQSNQSSSEIKVSVRSEIKVSARSAEGRKHVPS